MGKHIDTAPVLEAFAEGGECPLCSLRDKTEEGYLDQFLGGSVMEPDVRITVNEKGFCGRHFTQLYAAKNRLGLALMTHTHLKETITALEKRWSEPDKGSAFRLFGRGKADPSQPQGSAVGHRDACVLCDRLSATMERYIETTLWLWKNDNKFRARFNESQGVCVAHADALMSASNDNEFRAALRKLTLDNLNRVERELEWFTLKFDYRNQDKPWGNSKDALARAIVKLAGVDLRDE